MTTITDTDTAQVKFDKLASRKGELRAEIGTTTNEINTILDSLGALVASGASYTKQIARLAVLRQQVEALELAVQYVSGQCELLERAHFGLSRR